MVGLLEVCIESTLGACPAILPAILGEAPCGAWDFCACGWWKSLADITATLLGK